MCAYIFSYLCIKICFHCTVQLCTIFFSPTIFVTLAWKHSLCWLVLSGSFCFWMTDYCFISHLYYCNFLLLRSIIFLLLVDIDIVTLFHLQTPFSADKLIGPPTGTTCTITLLHVHTGTFIYIYIYFFLTHACEWITWNNGLPASSLSFRKTVILLTRVVHLTFVDPCIIVQFVKRNPTRCNNVSKILLFHIYKKLNMFRATHRPSSGA
jgi:hypothetical protein